jgi:hypothetical protein
LREDAVARLLNGAGLVVSAGLLLLGLWGRLEPPDYRDRFAEPLLSYDEALARLDAAHAAQGATSGFVAAAAEIYDAATAYEWPPGLARVSVRDNWILAALPVADPILHLVGLKNDGPLFGQFESFRYRRALGRGFGVCSQNALGFADLLQRRYGIAVRMVGLGGHVVTQVELPDGPMIADPSLGVTLPFGLAQAEENLAQVDARYAGSDSADLWNRYDRPGNVLAPRLGSGSYADPFWKLDLVEAFEVAADYASVALPAAVGLFFGWRLWRGGRSDAGASSDG